MTTTILVASGLEKVLENKSLFERQAKRTLWRVEELRLDEPAFVCLAGRNGAGKSTLLRCLLGLQRATRGEVSWYGARGLGPSVLGYLPEFPILPPALK